MKMSLWDIFMNNLWGWRRWSYPAAAKLPQKPWHDDGDVAFTSVPQNLHPSSSDIISHLKSTSLSSTGILFFTGSTAPSSGGLVNGYPLNLAKSTDGKYFISHEYGAWKCWISTSWSAPYGKTIRYNPAMMIQGNPMQDYSDHKLHVFDPIDATLTEAGEFYDRGNGCLQARKVTQHSMTGSSYAAEGCSVAKQSLAELTLRYDDLVTRGWVQRASMGVVAASSSFIWPAKGSDGSSEDEFAPPMGAVLRLKESARTRMTESGYGRGVCPQANAVMDCYTGPGIMIVDSGGNNSTMLEPDSRWDQKDLSALKQLTIDDFEVWSLRSI